jgi:hypothetical protein
MKRKSTRWMAASLLVSSVASCAYVTRESGPTGCAEPSARPATRVSRPEVHTASLPASNVVVEVTSTLPDRVRLTVQFGESLALDVRLPGTDCASQPVYRYGYRLPPGPIDVKATSRGSEDGTATLQVEEQKRWLVIQVQKGFPVSVREWSERPAWG